MSNSHPVEPSPPDSKGEARFVFLQSESASVSEDKLQAVGEVQHDGITSSYAADEMTSLSNGGGSGSTNGETRNTDANPSSFGIAVDGVDEKDTLRAAAPKTPAQQAPASATTKVDLYKADAVEYNDDTDMTRQSLYLAADDLVVSVSLYHRSLTRRLLWYFGCLLSAGILFIVAFWWPKLWIRWNCRSTTLDSATLQKCKGQIWVAVKTRHEPLLLCMLEKRDLGEEAPLEKIFPGSMMVPAANALDQPRSVADLGLQSPGDQKVSEVRILDYRSITFVLHPCGRFMTQADWTDPAWARMASMETKDIQGLSSDREHALLHRFFGPNVIDVKGNSIFSILINEVLHPFYIFQIASVILWCNDDYVPYAIVILVVSFIGITSATIETKRSLNRLRKMSRFCCDVRVLRHGNWRIVPSIDLVPGDVIDVAATAETGGKLEVLPCDVMLLESDAIASEAMLTGESVPVVKTAVPRSFFASASSRAGGASTTKVDKYTLFGGTKLIRARPTSPLCPEAKALVVRTGFHTAKGGLVRQMLFPKKFNFKFLKDAFMAIGCLFIIAMMGVVASAVYFVHIGVDPEEIALRSLDVITIAVPPALPTAMSIAVTFALVRLKRKQIYCTSPQRINVAGMITACVFDKTGTLTEEGLAVLGVCASSAKEAFAEPLRSHPSLEEVKGDEQEGPSLSDALATTHDLNLHEGTLLGEPLEAAMFKWTEAELSEEPVPLYLPDGTQARTVDAKNALVSVVSKGARKLAICRTFDFSPALRRMSVIVKASDQEQGATVYVKGAPEAIVGLCDRNSFPAKYDEVLNHFTHNGFRVLAFAAKTLEGGRGSWGQVKGMSRNSAESNLRFLGLLVFENKLKEGSVETVRLLKQGNVVAKMCTGDAPLTAIAVAREAGLVDANGPVYMARISGSGMATSSSSDDKEKALQEEEDNGSEGQDEKNAAAAASQVEWVDIADETATLDAYSLQPHLGSTSDGKKLSLSDIGLAVSGETYAYMVDHSAKETMDRLLVRGTVFARFSPEQKQDLIERLQGLDYAVAMVGDGANDMGALKSADVGLSLSEAEASVAAPFTTKDVRNVDCLLREGRNAITTSLALFDFMMIYSLCEYFSVLLLYGAPFFSTSFTNADYLYIDIFLVFPFAIGMSFSCPSNILSPKPVKGRLMSRRNLISLLSQFVLLVLAQTTTYLILHRQDFYQPPEYAPDDLDLQTMDNTIIFKTSIFSYLFAACIWNWGPPHRRYLFQNYPLLLAIVVIASLNVYFVFATAGPFFDLFGFQDEIAAPRFLGIVFAVVVVQGLLAVLSELYLVDLVAAWIRAPTRRIQRMYASSKGRSFSVDKAYRLVEASILVD